jgi:uncharacterized membrane protein
MDELKKWLPELAVCTIVAAFATLFTYILGLEDTWNEAFQTFLIAFVIMFVLGIYNRKKSNKSKNENQ